jgi:hypothetical protein
VYRSLRASPQLEQTQATRAHLDQQDEDRISTFTVESRKAVREVDGVARAKVGDKFKRRTFFGGSARVTAGGQT